MLSVLVLAAPLYAQPIRLDFASAPAAADFGLVAATPLLLSRALPDAGALPPGAAALTVTLVAARPSAQLANAPSFAAAWGPSCDAVFAADAGLSTRCWFREGLPGASLVFADAGNAFAKATVMVGSLGFGD